MTYLDSIQNLVRKVDYFIEDFNKGLQISKGFKLMINRLAKKYEENTPSDFYQFEENEFPFFFEEHLSDFNVVITIKIMCDKKGHAYISDDITLEYSCTEHGYIKCSISDIHQIDFQKEICEKINEHLKNLEYNIFITNKDRESIDFEDTLLYVTYTTFDAAKDGARKIAKKLNELYPQVLSVWINAHEKSDKSSSNNIYNVVYRISSKSKGETMRFERLGFDDSYADEFTEISPRIATTQNVDSITILTIITLDMDGNINYDIKRCKDKNEAKVIVNDRLKDWLRDNKYTTDKATATRYGFSLCTKYDYENSIEVYNREGIAGFEAIIKNFEI